MNNFLLSTASQQEIQSLDNKIHETVETINSLKTSREFFLSFAKDPQLFINKWLQSQSRDLKTMTDVTGNPEEERRVDFYYQPWVTESVCRSVQNFLFPTQYFLSRLFKSKGFLYFFLNLIVKGISTEKFNRKEQSWMPVSELETAKIFKIWLDRFVNKQNIGFIICAF